MIFHHYSPLESLTALDPQYCGTAKAGKERCRAAVKSICLYSPDGEVETIFSGCHLYKVDIPVDRLYDLSEDRNGYLCADFGLTERRIKRAGFVGYWLPSGTGIFKGQARLFKRWSIL